MARKNRFAPPGYWLHITQRGNDKQRIFLSDADRRHFLHLLETRSEQRAVRVAAYALMSNHFHLVATSDRPDAVSLFMMDLNGLYATHRNVTHHHTGRVWQGRFYSCVLDDAHWETALRYVEMNPVRAQVVKRAADFRWSSARAHLGLDPTPAWLDTDQFHRRWPTPATWQGRLDALSHTESRLEAAALRHATRQDGALGSDEFVIQLESTYQVQLRPKPLTQPRKRPTQKFQALAAGSHSTTSAKGR